MSKISIYEVAPVPKLADKLVGTSVGGDPEDITYNFTLSELLNLFIPNIPGNTLQGVLDFGNTATQDIILNGTIFTTYLEVTDTATILDSFLTGDTHITGGLYDRLNSVGTAGQVLRSTGTQVEWYSVPTVIPDLQQVLTSGNTAVNNIILTGNLSANNAALLTSTISTSLTLLGTLRDGLSSVGANNQVLSSNVTGVRWVNLPVYSATSPLLYNSGTGVFSIQQSSASQDGYLSSADWITFDGKQTAISLTTTGNSGASTLISNTINVPNYTLSGLGGVPLTRTLTINGVTYNLSADRSWTLATGVSSVSATTPLFSTGGVNPDISIQKADSTLDGYLSSADWLTFNSKQPAGNYITSLTGEATGAGPGATAVTLSTAAVTGKLLTGLNLAAGGTISATDSILIAFGKTQNQISALVGGVIFKGTWNASTNTPTLVSSVGVQGNYYIVSVAGNTNLNGITDWQVGDWAIFNGTVWDKVDNTDAVSSVNGFTGAVNLTTDNIPEGSTNLYYTNTRARTALSFVAGSGAYNNTTGVITIPTNNNQITNGSNYITLASLSAVSPLSYINTTGVFSISQSTTSTDGYLSSIDWNTFNNKQATITLTTTGTSGAATLVGATLNIPQYQSVLTNPITGTGTTNTLPKFTAASTIGNSNITDTGSLISLGSNSFISGLLGIGAGPLTGYAIRISKDITGLATSYGIVNDGTVLSDVTSNAYYYRSIASTQAATFTLGNLYHNFASQGTFGAGSSVTNQYGFHAASSLIGATNNYGFQGSIPSGTGRWNLYMTGTAENYLAGNTGIGVSGNLVSSGPILTSTLTNGGTGYVDGTYTDVAVTAISAVGLYALYTIVVSGGIVTTATLTWAGVGYKVGNTISVSNTLLGGTGSGLIITIDTVNFSQLTIASATGGDITLFRSDTSLALGENLGTIKWNSNDSSSKASGIAAEIGAFAAGTLGGAYLSFSTRSVNAGASLVEAMRIDSRGSVGIGATALTQYSLRVSKNITGAVTSTAIFSDGVIQSGVTTNAYNFLSYPSTVAASFTLTNLHHFNASQNAGLGAGSAVTNQFGFIVDSSLTAATNNYGFYGNIPSGTNRWNLYMGGTAANYLAGSLGIGSTGLTNITLRLGKTITGSTTSYAIYNAGVVQSDVTGAAWNNISELNTAASAFTLANFYHYGATQGTIGAGSSITTQRGFFVNSNLTGATINYGFQGSIPSGTNRWNIYMDGTADNYMAGSLGIGSTSLTGYNLRVSKSITGAVTGYGIALDTQIQSDVTTQVWGFMSKLSTAAASFTIGGGIRHFFVNGFSLGAGSTIGNQYGFYASLGAVGSTNYGFYGDGAAASNVWNIYMVGTANNYMAGSLGIGTTSLTNTVLKVAKNNTGATAFYGITSEGSTQSDVTSQMNYFATFAATQATTFTLSSLIHFRANQSTFGVGSTVTNQYGILIDASLTGATNNFGFYGNIPSGTNRWNLYMNGTAANYMAGQTGVGTTTLGSYIFNVGGSVATLVNFNSTNASGFYTTYSASGVEKAYIGLGANTISGLAISDFGIVGSANIVIASGSGGTETMRIDSTKRIGIGTGASINASAKVQIDSTTSGFLPPRMTAAQRTAIATPATGLIVYQTDSVEGLWLNTSTGWRELTVV